MKKFITILFLILGLGLNAQTFDFSCGNTVSSPMNAYWVYNDIGRSVTVHFPGHTASAISWSLSRQCPAGGHYSGGQTGNFVNSYTINRPGNSGNFFSCGGTVLITIDGREYNVPQGSAPEFFGITGPTFTSGDHTFNFILTGIPIVMFGATNARVYLTQINGTNYNVSFEEDNSHIILHRDGPVSPEFTATSVADFHAKFAEWIFNNFINGVSLQWIENTPHIRSSFPAPDGLEWGWIYHQSGHGNIAGSNANGTYCNGDCDRARDDGNWADYNNPATNYNVGETYNSRAQFDSQYVAGRYFVVDFRYNGVVKTIDPLHVGTVPDPLSQFELDEGTIEQINANGSSIVDIRNNTNYIIHVYYDFNAPGDVGKTIVAGRRFGQVLPDGFSVTVTIRRNDGNGEMLHQETFTN